MPYDFGMQKRLAPHQILFMKSSIIVLVLYPRLDPDAGRSGFFSINFQKSICFKNAIPSYGVISLLVYGISNFMVFLLRDIG
jgi:hypothetical protein